jgi:Mn-dependent DtxR family transcriptional regulator
MIAELPWDLVSDKTRRINFFWNHAIEERMRDFLQNTNKSWDSGQDSGKMERKQIRSLPPNPQSPSLPP